MFTEKEKSCLPFRQNRKFELVQINHTPIICPRNFVNKKVRNRKNQDHYVISTFETDIT